MNQKTVIASLNVSQHPGGKIFQPLERKDDVHNRFFAEWESALAPWGGFNLNSGMEVVNDSGRNVIAFNTPNLDRMITYEASDFRDVNLVAELKPIDTEAKPNDDRNQCSEALVGIVFRLQTSRCYYQFGIEGKKRAVLYRRNDDEWFLLANKEVDLTEGYITLKVHLDGDGITCECDELGVKFFCTDRSFNSGKVGFRSHGRSNLAFFQIEQFDWQVRREERRRNLKKEAIESLGEGIADPVMVKTFDLATLGGHPLFCDFVKQGRYDMLIPGKTLKAMTCDQEVIWETPLSVSGIVFSQEHKDGGRLIYGLAGTRNIKTKVDIQGRSSERIIADELVLINGVNGEILAKTKLPEFHENISMPDLSMNTGNMTGRGAFDIALREWRSDYGDGGLNIWAYSVELELLWHREIKGAYYGHHFAVQFFDVDKDGYDELLAGGKLFRNDGNLMWVHDADDEMMKIFGAHHYDAVALGNFSGDDSIDPVAFLLGGSAGVYVVDGRTGRTRAVHRVGHAQGRTIGKVREDFTGEQILVATRWGNMGILTLFSGHGDRLWSIQPDYIGQGACFVKWGKDNLIWTNTTGKAQAFYDGYGRCVKELIPLRNLWGERMRAQVSPEVIRMGTDPVDYICLNMDAKMHVFGPKD